jgi:ATP-binding cassette subfamily B protein
MTSRAFYRRLLSYAWPYRLTFFAVLGQIVVMSLLEVLKPWPLKIVIDHVIGGTPTDWPVITAWTSDELLAAMTLALVVIYSLLAGVTVLYHYTTISSGQRLVNDIRRDLYHHLQRLSLSFHHRHPSGDLLHRVTADTYAFQNLIMKLLFPMPAALITVLAMAIIMFRMDPLLTLLSMAVCPALYVTISRLNKQVNTAAVQARKKEGQVYSVVQGTLASMRVIQAFTKEDYEQQRFMMASTDSLGAHLRLYTLQTVYSGIVNVLIAVGTAAVVWVGARHVLAGTLSVGDLVVFIAYLASLYGPINSMTQTSSLIQEAKAGVDRVFEILDVERDLEDGHRPLVPTSVRGAVTFEHVSFKYVPARPVLQDINLSVLAGQRVAIVGSTGAGKSTLVSLIARFYDPLAGRVLIDGVDVRDYRVKDVRGAIAMVLQPPLVFPVSIRENIAYGRMDASLDEVVAAAQLARIHEFIASLPEGYETIIGQQGATLSEGERLRITIARALLRNAPILILDEPTSSVDVHTERLIMAGLDTLMTGRTTFIIAHRLSTVRRADNILVLEQGKIVETGTFTHLLSREGVFQRLYLSHWQNVESETEILKTHAHQIIAPDVVC